VRAALTDRAGARVGTALTLSGPESGTTRVPSVAASKDGYLVVWYEPHSERVVGARVTSAGKAHGASFTLSHGVRNSDYEPSLAI